MTETTIRTSQGVPWIGSRVIRSGALLLLASLSGCMALPWSGTKTDPVAPAADSMTFRPTKDEPVDPSNPVVQELKQARAIFESARGAGDSKVYNEAKLKEAEGLFHKIAKNEKNPPVLAEEARFFEAECQFLRGDFRTAEGTYKKLMKDFRMGKYVDRSNQRLFHIANYWLDDTREQMKAQEEKREGKRWFVTPASFVHFSKDKPFLDTEGHAVQALEEVRLNDINGPLGERALFYLATVKFFREEYRQADYYYSQLFQNYPNSELAPKAMKQAIVCKQIVNGGSVYDTRTLAEATKLAHTAVTAYPQLATTERQWVQEQLIRINLQQADRDMHIAEFYRRTNHPGSAFFYYELVKRRYPNTPYADKAEVALREIRGQVEEEKVRGPRTNSLLDSGWLGWLPGNRQRTEDRSSKGPATTAAPATQAQYLPPTLDGPPKP